MSNYSHRNGEKSLPTERGWYWFHGKHIDEKRKPVKQKYNLYVYGGVTDYRDPNGPERIVTSLQKLKGRWWGPLMPPWDES